MVETRVTVNYMKLSGKTVEKRTKDERFVYSIIECIDKDHSHEARDLILNQFNDDPHIRKIVSRLRVCANPACSKLFIQTDGRQSYCDPQCSNQKRQREFRSEKPLSDDEIHERLLEARKQFAKLHATAKKEHNISLNYSGK